MAAMKSCDGEKCIQYIHSDDQTLQRTIWNDSWVQNFHIVQDVNVNWGTRAPYSETSCDISFFRFFFYNPTDRPNIRKRIKQGRGDGLSRNNQVTLVSSPDWILLGRNIQKHVLDSVVVYLTVKKAGKEKELEATGVKLKRTKHRKTLFAISRRTNIWCFCWWLRLAGRGVVFYTAVCSTYQN